MSELTHEFLHHLRDTIILLGGGTRIADLAQKAEAATQREVDELRQINIRLIDTTKYRLTVLNSVTITGGDQ